MNNYDGNSEKFLTTYNELDKYMREYLNESGHSSHSDLINKMAKVNKVFNANEYNLRSFANLRNAIVHNPNEKFANPIAEPHDFIVKRYEEIKNKVMNPPKALDTIAIKRDNIFTASLNSKALEIMEQMNKNIFTHVPIVDNDILVGVFSENTVFSYIVKNQEVLIDSEMLIKEFAEYIPINNHGSESFKFVSRETLVIDIEGIFQEGIKDNKRISAVFITENGNENEKLLGMLTAWDVAGYGE